MSRTHSGAAVQVPLSELPSGRNCHQGCSQATASSYSDFGVWHSVRGQDTLSPGSCSRGLSMAAGLLMTGLATFIQPEGLSRNSMSWSPVGLAGGDSDLQCGSQAHPLVLAPFPLCHSQAPTPTDLLDSCLCRGVRSLTQAS